MTVLSIIIGLVVLAIVGFIVQNINEHSYRDFQYEFFSSRTFTIGVIGYALIYIGLFILSKASIDPLNAYLLIGIGTSVLIYLVFLNISNTSFEFAFMISIFQLSVYAIASFFVLIIFILLVAWASDTKPVYSIGSR